MPFMRTGLSHKVGLHILFVNNSKFFFFEVKTVIYKKIREEQYDEEINNILRKLA